MGANKNSNESVRFFKLIAKAEKANTEEKMAIVEVVKNGKKEYAHGEWFGSLSGFITSLEIKGFEFEGEKKEKFVMHIEDADGICQLEFTNSIAAQGLINGLLATDLTKEVEVSAWISKNGYVGAGVKYKGEKDSIKWAIDLKDCPRPTPYKLPSGKDATDNANVLEFWKGKFTDLAKKAVKENFAGQRDTKTFAGYVQNEEPKQQSSKIAENKSDDLPF
jgi:hypothetical protein